MSSANVRNEAADVPEPSKAIADQDILVAWYGDDFTGAAATMEVLTFAGLQSLLFLDIPTLEQLQRFPDLRGIGIASTARTKPPEWMDATLPGGFAGLGALDPGLVHYKVCSTLDSSPETGSIGRAIEIGAACFETQVVPVLVAAPCMQRYQCFGHLFAGAGDDVVRLDRHPVMSRHPVTPMTESDVARHICKQSDRLKGHMLPFPALADGSARLPDTASSHDLISVVAIDSIDAGTDARAGQLIWEARDKCRFVVGSQGIEYALVEQWQNAGVLDKPAPARGIGRSDRMMSVSGSVSPTTADQIAWAQANGFSCIAFDAARVTGGKDSVEAEIQRTAKAAVEELSQGRDPLVHTAEGPDDPAVERFREAVAANDMDMSAANRTVGEALGFVLQRVLDQTGTTRAVVSGGDTSGFVTQQLGIYALSALAPTIPGASIFRAHAEGPVDGLELALKGGQMGTPDYFGWVRDGGGAR